MKKPKISKRKRDGMFVLVYNDYYGNRKRKSLGSKNSNEAKLAFINIIGILPQDRTIEANPSPQVAAPLQDNQRQGYTHAVNEFLLCKYGIVDGWSAQPKAGCALKSTSVRVALKMFQAYSKVYYVSEIHYSNLQGFKIINGVQYQIRQ